MDLLKISPERFTLLTYCPQIGEAPGFVAPQGRIAITERMKTIGPMFFITGDFNETHPDAENYAICLAHDNSPKEALRLFKMMTSKKVGNILDVGIKQSFPPMSCESRMLGYEGYNTFVRLIHDIDKDDERVKVLLYELVNKIPIGKGSIRCKDIVYNAYVTLCVLETDAEKLIVLNEKRKQASSAAF